MTKPPEDPDDRGTLEPTEPTVDEVLAELLVSDAEILDRLR